MLYHLPFRSPITDWSGELQGLSLLALDLRMRERFLDPRRRSQLNLCKMHFRFPLILSMARLKTKDKDKRNNKKAEGILRNVCMQTCSVKYASTFSSTLPI